MKKRYEAPELELLKLATENIATLSGVTEGDGDSKDWSELA